MVVKFMSHERRDKSAREPHATSCTPATMACNWQLGMCLELAKDNLLIFTPNSVFFCIFRQYTNQAANFFNLLLRMFYIK